MVRHRLGAERVDHRDDLLVLHPSSPRNAVSLTAETGVCCMFPRRYISCMRM
jgi:hypothetical protein